MVLWDLSSGKRHVTVSSGMASWGRSGTPEYTRRTINRGPSV